MYTVGSLFTGIGGIDLAFVRAGFEIAWQVEIDPFCRQVLARHAAEYWPGAEVFEDVKHVGRNELRTVDVMAGGFPCQDISQAGKKAGIKEGNRSGLWFEFARIIGELRPRIVLLENVPNIARIGGLDVVGQLTAMGYDSEWGIIPASAVGAPHRRERWWCVAYSESQRRGTRRAERQGQQWRTITVSDSQLAYSDVGGWGQKFPGDEDGTSERGIKDVGNPTGFRLERLPSFTGSIGAGENEGRLFQSSGTRHGATESIMGRVLDGLSRGLDTHRWPARPGAAQFPWEAPRTISQKLTNRPARLKALGNAVVPQVVQPIAEAIYSLLEEQDHAAMPDQGRSKV